MQDQDTQRRKEQHEKIVALILAALTRPLQAEEASAEQAPAEQAPAEKACLVWQACRQCSTRGLMRAGQLVWGACKLSGILAFSGISAMLPVGCQCSHVWPWKGSGAATPPWEVGGAGPSASKHIQPFVAGATNVTQEQRRFRREPGQERPDFKNTRPKDSRLRCHV